MRLNKSMTISCVAAAWGMATATLVCIDEVLKKLNKEAVFPDGLKKYWMAAYIVVSVVYFVGKWGLNYV